MVIGIFLQPYYFLPKSHTIHIRLLQFTYIDKIDIKKIVTNISVPNTIFMDLLTLNNNPQLCSVA